MATVVCQGLQSCLESQLLESTTLRLRSSSSSSSSSSKLLFSQSLELPLKPNRSSTESDEVTSQNPDNGGWSFLQDLTNSNPDEKENVYVHPLMNRYSSKLSEKSLEMCTESLGCETGSDISSESSFLFDSSISSSESESEEEEITVRSSDSDSNSFSISKQKVNENLQKQKPCEASINRSFPPPLTTMNGAESLQFRPRREGGRLVITAVKAPASRSCFQAERSGGRLRLSFVKDSATSFDTGENDVEEEEEDEEEGNDAYEEEEEGGNLLEEEERDTEGNNLNVGGEIGKEEFAIRRNLRCKDGEIEKNGLLNWEPFWVAT